MKVLTQLRKVGGSIMVIITEEVLKQESLQPGDTVKLNISKISNNVFGSLKA